MAGAFGTAGGALGPHLEESNRNYPAGRSRGSSTEGAPKPPTTDERFDFSDTASGSGALSGGSPPPAESGVGGKFDLSDVGGSPPADPGSASKAATTGTAAHQREVPHPSHRSRRHLHLQAAGGLRLAVRRFRDRRRPARRWFRSVQRATPSGDEVRGGGTSRANIHLGRARPFYAKDPKARPGLGRPPAKGQRPNGGWKSGFKDVDIAEVHGELAPVISEGIAEASDLEVAHAFGITVSEEPFVTGPDLPVARGSKGSGQRVQPDQSMGLSPQ